PRARSVGIGRSLVRRALEVAGGREVILLTETAPGVVEALGFDTVERAAVVGPVTTPGEWTGLCPDTAVVMRRAATATGGRRRPSCRRGAGGEPERRSGVRPGSSVTRAVVEGAPQGPVVLGGEAA